ncbi:SAF domain-containing protein [Cryptosporangium aurantiacum]|uniref:SAF domain-containing protein n=1 Tax=Cryptosporangium aurantiacum TaxID=134849 RepID=A0A1M7R8Z9_9ACTN|nr:SAF domain-containing protein [Cryptosporangium aurantiacum]SHN42713.1 SAF domain-containing protein [Cryptosporangium aurantiacum]
MSRSATGTPTQTPVTSGPVPAPRVVGQRRVRTGHLGLAVALVAIGGLLAAFAFYAATRTGDYLAVARPVAAGATITAEDLAVVQVNSTVGLTPLAASERGSVVGKRAKVSLVPGTLLTKDQLTDVELVGPGQQQVGIGLKPERMPAKRLSPGDKVQLVSTPAPNATSDEPDSSETFAATVVDTSPRTDNDATTVLYVAVSANDAPRVVELAAAERLGVVLTGAR